MGEMKDRKLMAQSTKMANEKSKNGGSFTSTCTAIRKTLRKLMGDAWKEEMRYEIAGTPFPEAKAVVFELKDAVELEPFASRGYRKKVVEDK